MAGTKFLLACSDHILMQSRVKPCPNSGVYLNHFLLDAERVRKNSQDCPSHKYPDLQASQELAKNYLLFRAARNAIDDRIRAVEFTDIQLRTINGDYEYQDHFCFRDELRKREKALEKCRTMMRDVEFAII